MSERSMTKAERDVLAERAKQRSRWTTEHDQIEHGDGELASAATAIVEGKERESQAGWANHAIEKHGPRQRLVIAAALLIAEIDRLDADEDDQ